MNLNATPLWLDDLHLCVIRAELKKEGMVPVPHKATIRKACEILTKDHHFDTPRCLLQHMLDDPQGRKEFEQALNSCRTIQKNPTPPDFSTYIDAHHQAEKVEKEETKAFLQNLIRMHVCQKIGMGSTGVGKKDLLPLVGQALERGDIEALTTAKGLKGSGIIEALQNKEE